VLYGSSNSSLIRRVHDFRRLASVAPSPRALSSWLIGTPPQTSIPSGPMPTIIAVGGGKGGVGKSIISANISARLASSGLSVLAVDLDIGGANLHTHFGLPYPDRTLPDFLVHGRRTFRDLALATPVQGLRLIAGGRDEAWDEQINRNPAISAKLYDSLTRARVDCGADIVVLDLGAGTYRHTMDFFALAHMGVVVVLPEPTSIENAYVFLKATLLQYLHNACHRIGRPLDAIDIEAQLTNTSSTLSAAGHVAKLQALSHRYPSAIRALSAAIHGHTIGFVVNQTRSQQDIDIARSMETISQRFFGLRARALGHLNHDDAAWKALRNKRLVTTDFPHSGLSVRFGAIAEQILSHLSTREG
jgi:flagellar biosynthesis protein FlhG